MEFKPVRSKKEHQIALAEVQRPWNAPAKSPAAGRLDVLTMSVEVLIKPYRLRREAGELEAA